MITNSIKYVGVNDFDIDLFESQYNVPNGISYNSYVILDEKIAVMDSVEIRFADEWIGKIKSKTEGRSPDYLIIQHMEPDHASGIMRFALEFPSSIIVATAKAFNIINNFFGTDLVYRRMIVGEADTLPLGKHALSFITAPMVHWPEVMLSYDSYSHSLFSADAFGKFGAICTNDEWIEEARRYYFGIVGKYGIQVQSLLKKAADLKINAIYPLHGPIINHNIDYYLNIYNKWSSYQPECEGVCIAYASIYGNTESAIKMLKSHLSDKNITAVALDLARCDIHEAIANAFKYDRLVLASPTYNCGLFPSMREFINHLTERNFQNRRVAFIENGSWAPVATHIMKSMLGNSKKLTFAKNEVRILSAMNDDSRAQIKSLADELSK